MLKAEFFLRAMRAGMYRERRWVISVFSQIMEAPDAWKDDPYPYRIVQSPSMHAFVNPEDVTQLIRLDDAEPGQPPISIKERITPPAGSIVSMAEPRETSYGQILVNYVVLINAVGAKIPFQFGRLKPGNLENLILPLFRSDPQVEAKEGEVVERDPKYIYPDEYVKFCDGAFQLTAFMQVCVPAGTRKTMTEPPGTRELKQKLLDENRDRLHDRAVIAKIQKTLNEHIKSYLKGDPGEDFLIFPKSHNVVRAKLYGMLGAEAGIDANPDADLIQNSLAEGWNPTKLPAMINTLRGGSHNRGVQTMLGGESVKWLYRASSNIRIAVKDCGSRLGRPRVLTEDNRKGFMGFSVVTDTGYETLNEENFSQYVGKLVMVRSTLHCWSEHTDYCEICMGPRLSLHPMAASAAVADYGDKMMYIFMKAMHGKELATKRLDWRKHFK